MTLYRPRLVGLPLQRSLFREIGHCPALLGLRGVLPGDRLAARVDDAGDLYLDRAEVDRLASALVERATPALVAEMAGRLGAACAELMAQVERAAALPTGAESDRVRTQLADLGAAIAGLLPYGILSKFIPDTLLRILESNGDRGGPPFPARSPGATLTLKTLSLARDCAGRGWSASRLAAEWPDVPSEVRGLVADFCREQTGWGPLAWDAPGYEDPLYLFGVLGGIGTDTVSEALLRRLEPVTAAAAPMSGPDLPSAVRAALTVWLEFLELETWYVRRAFYLGLLPLLHRLLPWYGRLEPMLTADDLLFFTLDELVTPGPMLPPVGERRAALLADAIYQTKYNVSAARLRRMVLRP